MYKLLISSYLCLSFGIWSALVMFPAHRDVNILKDSSTMSHLASSPRMCFRARVFSTGISYCGGRSSDIGYSGQTKGTRQTLSARR